MKPTTRQAKCIGLLGLLLATGCGKDAQPADQTEQTQPAVEQAAPPVTNLDACSLLKAEEVHQITGKSFVSERLDDTPNLCMFRLEDGRANFNYGVNPAGSENNAEAMIGRYKAMGVTVTDVPGIGDRSFYSPHQGMTQLNTYKGKWHVMLSAAYLADDQAQEQQLLNKLMLQIITRL